MIARQLTRRPPARRGAGRAALLFLTTVLLPAASPALAEEVIVAFGSTMTHLANTSDPGIGMGWTAPGFDDSSWPSGTYGVGYESGSGAANLIQTQVSAGSLSVYTRARFTVSDVNDVHSIFLGADYDDGYVAWINGVEVHRAPEMNGLPLDWNTGSGLHESSNGAVPDYGVLQDISSAGIPALVNGENVLAVGVWNAGSGSSDLVVVPWLSFNRDLERGPYLQQGTPTSVVVRWRTIVATDSRVRYGPTPSDLSTSVLDPILTTEHEVSLDGLSPATAYYYAVGASSGDLAGADFDHFFVTHPPAGQPAPTRLWALGDSGTANANAKAVRDAYYGFTGGRYTDLWIMLGDNAYPQGTDQQYQQAVFDIYPEMLRRSVLWPTIGNHDLFDSVQQTWPYYDNFTMPTQGEAGGVASGTEAYYSYDYANIHFVVLDSLSSDRTPGSPMLTWLAADLASTERDWIIAYWHHPPYTKGSHDSDDEQDSGGRMVDMRQYVLPILEDYGVDLILTGHSHTYERSFLIDGHYGFSSSFVESMKVDGGDGNIDGGGAYIKPYRGAVPYTGSGDGAVYAVAGSSGQVTPGHCDDLQGQGPCHPAIFISLYELGSLVLDIDGNRLDARFLDNSGAVLDQYTIFKGEVTQPPVADFEGVPQSIQVSQTVSFADLSQNVPSGWQWDFEDDGWIDSTLRNPSHEFSQPGFYSVRMAASNSAGSDDETKSAYICVSGGAPDEITGLRIDAGGNVAWDANALSTSYDVVKGDLTLLRPGGDFEGSQLACLTAGVEAWVDDPAPPLPEQAFYYVARGDSCMSESGTFDTTGIGQAGSRDAALQGPGAVCP